MKLMDEKGWLFGKLNLFDLLILLILLAGVIGMAFRLLMPGVKEEERLTATYTVEMVKLDECYATAYQVGDTLYEDGVALGTVTAVAVTPAETAQILPDGSVGLVEHVMRYDILLTVTTDQFRLQDGYHVDSQELLAGTSHAISNGYAKAIGVVREISYQ
ncbi:MAG: DUF4330 domain-containing protein [Clostridia bacterium]|nr:DUF4330 domain-containing protein [Clostridia bacterium]